MVLACPMVGSLNACHTTRRPALDKLQIAMHPEVNAVSGAAVCWRGTCDWWACRRRAHVIVLAGQALRGMFRRVEP
jgi:hypothetical protein